MSKEVAIGDWVRFYQNNRTVIGVVLYITEPRTGVRVLCTDVGMVDPSSILEVRIK